MSKKGIEFLKSIRATDDCILWPWKLYIAGGYGRINLCDGRKITGTGAHRVSCTIHHGEPLDDSMYAIHSCRNRHCVNPRHIRWGTHSDNERDKIRDGTDNRGERSGKAVLKWEQVMDIRYGGENYMKMVRKYKISKSLVYAIRSHEIWKEQP
jgi:hypothetical protein